MSLHVPYAWEYQLLSWAEEALKKHTPAQSIQIDVEALDAAYRHCDEITRANSKTFYIASGLLPERKRRAVRSLYAFCRVTDDLVDRISDKAQAQRALLDWRERVMSPNPPAHDLVALAWADTCSRFNVPRGYAEQLIQGVARDLTQSRYETFADLAEYSYGVASTVGLMAMHIIGYSSEEARPYAVRLGVALQVTNILRDVAEDWRAGRFYLPLEDLARFGLDEHAIDAAAVDDRWREFMRFQIERNRRLYGESLAGIAMLDADGRFAIAAAAELYKAILVDIEAHHFDVFSRRAHISTLGKLRRLPGIWWRSRRASAHLSAS
jgi:phytoene synthase